MIYKTPHINKVYEALTALADDRVLVTKTQTDLLWIETITATVQTSSRDKSYTVTYQPSQYLIMSNDNSAYRNKEISYPMIALMIVIWQLPREDQQINKLANIHRKAINQQYDNDRDKSTWHVLQQLNSQGIDLESLQTYAQHLHSLIQSLSLFPLGPKVKPT